MALPIYVPFGFGLMDGSVRAARMTGTARPPFHVGLGKLAILYEADGTTRAPCRAGSGRRTVQFGAVGTPAHHAARVRVNGRNYLGLSGLPTLRGLQV